MILIDRVKSMKADPQLTCNLECVGQDLNSKIVQEYCGPVKIVVVQKPEERYTMKKWSTACYAYANICIGGLCISTGLHDSARIHVGYFTKAHAILGLYGLLFFSSFGMMNMNSDYGASFPLKDSDIRQQHALLHLTGLLVSASSVYFVYFATDDTKKELTFSSHVGICNIALISGVISFFLGIFFARIFKGAKKTAIHVIGGSFAYFCYCACALSGRIGHWPVFPAEKNNYFFEAYVILLLLICTIILVTSAIFILNLCRQIKHKARPVCLDEEQLKKDKKVREKARKEERKRRDLLKQLGKQSQKLYDTQ